MRLDYSSDLFRNGTPAQLHVDPSTLSAYMAPRFEEADIATTSIHFVSGLKRTERGNNLFGQYDAISRIVKIYPETIKKDLDEKVELIKTTGRIDTNQIDYERSLEIAIGNTLGHELKHREIHLYGKEGHASKSPGNNNHTTDMLRRIVGPLFQTRTAREVEEDVCHEAGKSFPEGIVDIALPQSTQGHGRSVIRIVALPHQ